MSRRANAAGFTLVELMITMAIASIVMAGAIAASLGISNGFQDQRDVQRTEQGARIALNLLADTVRAASPGVDSGVIADGVSCSDLLSTPMNAMRILNDPGGTYPHSVLGDLAVAPDTDVLEVMWASGGVYTFTTSPFAGVDTSIAVANGATFRDGDYLIITDLQPGSPGVLMLVNAAGSATSVPVDAPDTRCSGAIVRASGYPAGSLVIRAKMARYFVTADPAIDTLYNTMMLDPDADGNADPQPIAPGIEDFQIAVGIDANDDNAIAVSEWLHDQGSETHTPISQGNWRAVRLSLIARSLDAAAYDVSTRPALEDRAAGGAADGYRRRVLSTVIDMRNMEGSP